MNVKLMLRGNTGNVIYLKFESPIGAEAAASSMMMSSDIMYCAVLVDDKAIGGYLRDSKGHVHELVPV